MWSLKLMRNLTTRMTVLSEVHRVPCLRCKTTITGGWLRARLILAPAYPIARLPQVMPPRLWINTNRQPKRPWCNSRCSSSNSRTPWRRALHFINLTRRWSRRGTMSSSQTTTTSRACPSNNSNEMAPVIPMRMQCWTTTMGSALTLEVATTCNRLKKSC